MMMKKLSARELEFEVDLATVEGDGSFQCPKCGLQISPDDESEDNYEILDTKVEDDKLSELIISCGKCKSTIRLIGFLQAAEAQ